MAVSGNPFRFIALLPGALGALVASPSAIAQIPCNYEITAVIQGPWCGGAAGYPPTYGRGVSANGEVVCLRFVLQ